MRFKLPTCPLQLAALALIGYVAAAVAQQPERMPEKVLKTVEAQRRGSPREYPEPVAAFVRDAMNRLPRPEAADPERQQQAAALAELLIPHIEAQAETTLSSWQRRQIEASSLEWTEGLYKARTEFAGAILDAVEIPEVRLGEILASDNVANPPSWKKLLRRTETVVGRPLRQSEQDRLEAVDKEMRAALKKLQEKLTKRLTTITGLSTDDMDAVMTKISAKK